MGKFKRFLTLFKKLVENPGRIFFLRGAFVVDPSFESVPDSFSTEYYLMIQQKARLQLIHTVQRVNHRRLWNLPWIGVLFIKKMVQLRVVNALVQSYLNEQVLMKRVLNESKTKNCDSQA